MIFSLATERVFSNVIRNTPEDIGPGVYNIMPKLGNKKKMKAPFGTRQERNLYPKPDMEPPCPGDYEAKPLSSSIKIASVFQSESPRKVFLPQNTPSPAEYGKINDWSRTPPRQMHQKKLKTARPHSGFVGQDVSCYATNQNGEWIPMKKEKKGPEFIGPGTYTPIEFQTKYNIALDTTAKRELFVDHEQVPGPGRYTAMKRSDRLPVVIRELSRSAPIDGGEPSFVDLKNWATTQEEGTSSFRSRENRKAFPDPQPNPSPTAYCHAQKKEYSPGNSFGHKMDRKFIQPLTDNPGPGSYDDVTNQWIKGGDTGTQPRSVSQIEFKEKTPGPGAYVKLNKWKCEKRPSSVFKSRTKREPAKQDIFPSGPDYSPQIPDKNRVVPPLIHESRFEKFGDWIESAKIETPAPDLYQNINIKPGKGLTIPVKYRDDDLDNKVPGPGAYNVVHKSLMVKSHNSHVINIE